MGQHRTLIAIPAYNEENTIGPLIEKIKSSVNFDIVVFDDASTDRTIDISNAHQVRTISNSINQGYEKNLNRAYKYAVKNGYYCLIFIDADGEHDPKFLEKFQIITKNTKACIGVRKSFNRFGEVYASKLSKILFGIKDPYCGMNPII